MQFFNRGRATVPKPPTAPVPPAPASPPKPPAAEPPTAPAPEPPALAAVDGWSWLTPTRVVVGAAALPSLLSLVWLASTVAQITGGPSGWAAGVFADVVIVSTVAIAWFAPDVRRMAGIGGWAAAIAASALLGWHHWGTEAVAFSLLPVGSKFLWHVALMARTAWEARRDQDVRARVEAERQEREAEVARAKAHAQEQRLAAEAGAARQAAEAGADDCSLTVEQRREIADLKRAAAFARAKAEAEAEEATAKIHAEKTVDMATDQAEADRLKARYELAAQIGGGLPLTVLAQFLPDLPGMEVTEVAAKDRSRVEAAPRKEVAAAASAGFGFAQPRARVGGASPTGLGVPPHACPDASPCASPQEEDLPVSDRLLRYVADNGAGSTVKGAARELGVDPRTVRRYRDDLALDHDMSALYSTR
ncbi:hypothetical protein [Nocardiopsis ansamitocini]|uniref:DUF2637 domain-containing protein n=1 Tax=Nocardiopsis ansamitocini TaxID=1670832 RepID=A0A9W6P2Y3_9ACTN|nr:hypothetical protein [Nocardiopsis ansamitocini]GLU46300.1 hypothetical protein Nans01_06510 [Nocardiopsis ansamitocini]